MLYREQGYHLSEWRHNHTPRNKELFNYQLSIARNIIERCFGFFNIKWGIFREMTRYLLKTKCRIIFAYTLLHNHIRKKMTLDSMEDELSEIFVDFDALEDVEIIQYIETSNTWTTWGDHLAQDMRTEWLMTMNK